MRTERVLASVIEAVIGACYLAFGFERTAAAVVEAFGTRSRTRSSTRRTASRRSRSCSPGAATPWTTGHGEAGPPHDRTFEVVATVTGDEVGRGAGRSKKDAEQAAAAAALGALDALMLDAPEVAHAQGVQVVPRSHAAGVRPGVSVIVGPNGSGKSNITDAVLWALGEQSPLAVRGQSMQDVIFGGARGQQARKEAEVELVIDNCDGAADLPLERDRGRPPAGPQRRGRVPPQRRALPPCRRARGAVRHRAGQGDALGRLAGAGRGDRHQQAARPAPARRGGGRARQAPQAPAPRAAQARAHAGQPRPGARRRARGALAAAPAQAPGRGGRAARAPGAPVQRGALGAGARRARARSGRARAGRGAVARRARGARGGRGRAAEVAKQREAAEEALARAATSASAVRSRLRRPLGPRARGLRREQAATAVTGLGERAERRRARLAALEAEAGEARPTITARRASPRSRPS